MFNFNIFSLNRASLNIMKIVFVLLFSLVSSNVPEKIKRRTPIIPFSALREKNLSSVEIQTVKSNQNNTDSSIILRKENLESKVTYINSTIYAKPS